jgi:DNA-binding NarL/FixJ family response regulator
MIQLIIADDDVKVRSAINLLLDQDRSCWQVVSEVRDVDEMLSSIEKNKPQLLLLDWELPQACCTIPKIEARGLAERVKSLKSRNPFLYIIGLSSRPQARSEALLSGVDDFVAKTDPPEVFLKALELMCQREAHFHLV